MNGSRSQKHSPRMPPKYREARRVLNVTGAFFADTKAATVYRVLGECGWTWDAAAGQWARTKTDEVMSEGE